ncbi:hypothetical protein [Photobacterium leiognathi]|uniref:hypothetical protein n=1 Tax=Photobacterium leiognathi TaxID=553611 RepID=UPI002982005B|nr:hypothetical protein [Photobacterium leiognathi]
MKKSKLRLKDDLLLSFFSDELQKLLPPEISKNVEQKKIKGDSARTQNIALFNINSYDKKGIDFYFNSVLIMEVLGEYFPSTSIEVIDYDDSFIKYVVSDFINSWLDNISLSSTSSSAIKTDYYFLFGDYEVGLSIPKDVEDFILESHLKLNINKRISLEKNSNVFSNQCLELNLSLPKIKVKLDDIFNLKIGDKIRTDRRIDSGLILNFKTETVVRNVFVSYQKDLTNIVIGEI